MRTTPPTRRTVRFLSSLVLAALAAFAGRSARADDPPPAPASDDDKAEQVERQTKRGWAAFRQGNHDEALLRMERLAKIDPGNPLPRLLTARVYARTGKYEAALALATEEASRHPDDRAVEALRFDLLRRLGRSDEAATAAAAAVLAHEDDLVAGTVKGLLLEERGRRTEALAQYDRVIAAYNARDPLPEELSWVAQAAIRATWLSSNPADNLLPGAQRLLKKRIDADPDDTDALLVYADLHQSMRGRESQSTAGKYYKELLDQNPAIAEARVGQARVALVFGGEDQAVLACRRALESDPSNVPAMNILASAHVGDGDYDQADQMWKRATAVNPLDKEARAIHAARLFITGDKAGYDALGKEILAYDPTYGALYWITADLVGTRQRRFDVAADLSAKAIETDPRDPQAYLTHAVNLMNLGREKEAKASFDKATEAAKGYDDVVRENFLQVLEVLDTFREAKSEHFILRESDKEADAMEPYLLPLLEDAWTTLSKKYDFTPEGPILVESFHRHDDMSARTLGVMNLPILGVCFGKVIALDGPFARGLGENCWARTAWHEFAHVVTLQMSKGQVPRWLTEGLSVSEEKARRPQWGREMDVELFNRWKNGRLLTMAEINRAFRGPDVMFAYFEGGLIADHVQATWGFSAIQKMLRRFADDVPTEKVFTEVLHLPIAEYDQKFRDYVASIVSGWKMVPRWDDESKKAFSARVAKDPKDAEAWTRLGWWHAQRGHRVDAGAALEKAVALAPEAPEVILLQAEMARSVGLDKAAEAQYRKFLATGNDDLACRLYLAKVAAGGDGGYEAAVREYEAAKACFPRYVGKDNPYLELEKLHAAAGKPEKALAELEAYARIAAQDYGARRELLKRYVEKGDDEAILATCQEMIEINPFGANAGKPPDLQVHPAYARALAKKGRKEEAAREWKVERALLLRVEDEEVRKAGMLEARLERARLLLDLSRAPEALEEATAAISIDPNSEAARELRRKAIEAGGDK